MTERTFKVEEWTGAAWALVEDGLSLGDAQAMWRCAGKRRLRIR